MTDIPKRSCAHAKNDGTACLAQPQHGSAYCFFHDPETAAKRHESRRQGGVERTRTKAVLGPGVAKVRIRGTRDVVKLAAATIQQVRCGQLEVRIANSIAQLSGVVLKAMELSKALNEDAPIAVQYIVVAPNGTCTECGGRKVNASGQKCEACGGKGRVDVRENPDETCLLCAGTGEDPHRGGKCPLCHGAGRLENGERPPTGPQRPEMAPS